MRYVLQCFTGNQEHPGFIIFNTTYQSLPEYKDVYGILALGIIINYLLKKCFRK
jgi:hypothetical protein